MDAWTGPQRLDGVRVLVVEAEPRVRGVVADVLRQCGAQVTSVDSAVAGLAVVKRERPDALLSNISMPDKDGYWLIREVRKLPRDQGGDVPRQHSPVSPPPRTGSPACELAFNITFRSRWP